MALEMIRGDHYRTTHGVSRGVVVLLKVFIHLQHCLEGDFWAGYTFVREKLVGFAYISNSGGGAEDSLIN